MGPFQENKGLVGIIAMVAFTPFLSNLALMWNTAGSIATVDDITAAIDTRTTVHAVVHEALDLELAAQNDKLDRLEAFTRVVPRLRDLLKAECMGAVGLRDAINEFLDDYEELTGEVYDEPSCAELNP